MLDGRPYQYYFARKNRNPALYYLKDSTSVTEGTKIDKPLLGQLLSYSNPKKFKVEDPDEDVFSQNSFSVSPPLTDSIWSSPTSNTVIEFDVQVTDNELTDFQEGIKLTITAP
jgi:hypothetical protein